MNLLDVFNPCPIQPKGRIVIFDDGPWRMDHQRKYATEEERMAARKEQKRAYQERVRRESR